MLEGVDREKIMPRTGQVSQYDQVVWMREVLFFHNTERKSSNREFKLITGACKYSCWIQSKVWFCNSIILKPKVPVFKENQRFLWSLKIRIGCYKNWKRWRDTSPRKTFRRLIGIWKIIITYGLGTANKNSNKVLSHISENKKQ